MPNPSPVYTPELVSELRALVAHCATWEEAKVLLEKRLGTHPDSVRRMQNRHGFWKPAGAADWGGSAAQDSFSAEVETSKAATLDEVIALCGVDTEQYESRGFSIRRGAKGFSWNARFSRKAATRPDTSSVTLETLVETFSKRAAEHAPKQWVLPKERKTGDQPDCLYVLNLQDIHVGKLAHGKETGGADWDTGIANVEYRAAVNELIAKAPTDQIEEVVVIVGSDMLQVDTDQSTTTAGTYVDSDSRLSKVFDSACKMLTDVIEDLATRFKVRAVVVPGNHDSSCSHFLGRYVEAWFRSHPGVTVDASPRSRKYVGYGTTLIAFDHGDATKPKDLPLVIMRENQETISRYKHVEALVGHFHHEQSDDIKGIVVRVAPALCSPDRWHARAGFVGSVRRSQGLLYHKADGLQAIYYSRALD